MTNDFRMAVSCIFTQFWRLFTSWYIPGTNVTPAEFALFILFTSVLFRFLGDISKGALSGRSTQTGAHGSIRIPFKNKEE